MNKQKSVFDENDGEFIKLWAQELDADFYKWVYDTRKLNKKMEDFIDEFLARKNSKCRERVLKCFNYLGTVINQLREEFSDEFDEGESENNSSSDN